MALSLGIVGLPNVGKSTLFNALTKKQVDVANYPFCTIEPNVGVVKVPDERVDKLAVMSNSGKKFIPLLNLLILLALLGALTREKGWVINFLPTFAMLMPLVMSFAIFKIMISPTLKAALTHLRTKKLSI